jgi:hypothetical protein
MRLLFVEGYGLCTHASGEMEEIEGLRCPDVHRVEKSRAALKAM